jgi:hypothetical protein
MPHPELSSSIFPGALIVDTGPIWELVLYQAVNRFGFLSLRPSLKVLATPGAYENCGVFLSSFGRKTTSASVVAELYRKIRDTERRGHLRLWQQVLLDMDADLVARYGPTDVSLLEMARRHPRPRPIILTLDGNLYTECRKAQIACRLLVEICNPVSYLRRPGSGLSQPQFYKGSILR